MVKAFKATCTGCKETFPVKREEGKLGACEVECPYCAKKFDYAPPAADEEKKEGQQAEGDEESKDKETQQAAGAAVPLRGTFAVIDVEDVRKDERQKAQAFERDLTAAMDAAGLQGQSREDFRAKYGQGNYEISAVKEFALLVGARRTQPVGEGGASAAEGSKDKPSAAALAPFAARFKAESGLRRSFRCESDDPESEEYKAALARYLKSVNADPNFLPPVKKG